MEDSGNALCEVVSSGGEWQLDLPENASGIEFILSGYVKKVVSRNEIYKGVNVRLILSRPVGYPKKSILSPGDTLELSVHSEASFSVQVFRYGSDKKLVCETRSNPARVQQTPDGLFVDKGLSWDVNVRLSMPENLKAGLYGYRIFNDEGEEHWGPFVLSSRPSSPGQASAKILVLASDTTWQAYNAWGGRSRYRTFEKKSAVEIHEKDNPIHNQINFKEKMRKLLSSPLFFPAKIIYRGIRKLGGKKASPPRIPEEAWVLRRLSSQRPVYFSGMERKDPYELFCNHLAGAEWTVLAWLEKQNVDYDYCSTYEVEKIDLKNYSMVVLNTHNEYWSAGMFEALTKASDEGNVWLLCIGGNAIYREIETEDDCSIRNKGMEFNVTYRDETGLLGTQHTPSDFGTCAPYEVLDAEHWVFDQCGVKNGDLFGASSLNHSLPNRGKGYNGALPGLPTDGQLVGNGASGWETDKVLLERDEFKLLAKGQNYLGGADLVVRDPAGTKGAVLNFSSICAGGALPVDFVMSQMVLNFVNTGLNNTVKGES